MLWWTLLQRESVPASCPQVNSFKNFSRSSMECVPWVMLSTEGMPLCWQRQVHMGEVQRSPPKQRRQQYKKSLTTKSSELAPGVPPSSYWLTPLMPDNEAEAVWDPGSGCKACDFLPMSGLARPGAVLDAPFAETPVFWSDFFLKAQQSTHI